MTALAMSAPLLVGYPGPLRSEWTAGHSTRGWEGGQEGASIRGVNFGTTNLADFPRRRQHPAAARLPAGGDRLRLPLLRLAAVRRAHGDAGAARHGAAPL